MPEYGMITTDETGQEWFVWDFKMKFKVPWDSENPVFILCAPPGGIGHANFPAMVKGDRGSSARLQSNIDFTALEPGDPTPDSAELVEVSPGTDVTPQINKLVLKLHKGADGDDGASVLNPASFGTPVPKRILIVNATANGFEYAPQKVGGMHWPTILTEAPAGTTAGFVVSTITVAANTYAFDWRPDLEAMSLVSATTADTKVDLIARLTNIGGAILGRCTGLPGLVDRLSLCSGPDAGAGDAVNKIPANAAATIVLCTEKQGGAGTYGTGIIAPTRFNMIAVPVP